MPSFTEKLQINGRDMDVYASIPSGPGPFPAIVIAFHVGGMDEFDKAMADRLAAEGYVAVVPDLFHRLSEEVMAGPRLDRLGHLSDPDIIADVNASHGADQASLRIGDDSHGHVLQRVGLADLVVSIDESAEGGTRLFEPRTHDAGALHILGDGDDLDAITELLVE